MTIKQRFRPLLPLTSCILPAWLTREQGTPKQTSTSFVFCTYKVDIPGNTKTETENIKVTIYTDLSSDFLALPIMCLFYPPMTDTSRSASSYTSPYANLIRSSTSYRGAPVWIIAISKVGSWTCGLIGDRGHCFNGATEETAVWGPLPERANPASPMVVEDTTTTETSGKSSSGFGREAAAEGLDLLGYESGGGDVGVTEVADLLECLACSRQCIHIEGC